MKGKTKQGDNNAVMVRISNETAPFNLIEGMIANANNYPAAKVTSTQ